MYMALVNLALLKQFEGVKVDGNVENLNHVFTQTERRSSFKHTLIFHLTWNLPVCV